MMSVPVFNIGGIDLTYKILTKYDISCVPQYGSNPFVTENGEAIQDYKGNKVTISFSLRNVPTAIASNISDIMLREEFDCNYSAPIPCIGKFKNNSYKAVPKDKTNLWDIDAIIESISLMNISGNCL